MRGKDGELTDDVPNGEMACMTRHMEQYFVELWQYGGDFFLFVGN